MWASNFNTVFILSPDELLAGSISYNGLVSISIANSRPMPSKSP